MVEIDLTCDEDNESDSIHDQIISVADENGQITEEYSPNQNDKEKKKNKILRPCHENTNDVGSFHRQKEMATSVTTSKKRSLESVDVPSENKTKKTKTAEKELTLSSEQFGVAEID